MKRVVFLVLGACLCSRSQLSRAASSQRVAANRLEFALTFAYSDRIRSDGESEAIAISIVLARPHLVLRPLSSRNDLVVKLLRIRTTKTCHNR